MIKVSRGIKELIVKIKQIQNEYLKENGEEVTIEKIAKILKMPKEDVIFALESQNQVSSIDEEIYSDKANGETRISQIRDEKDETNSLINKICINEMIKELEEREQEIIILRYYKNRTQTEVAKKLGISQVQVSRIEKKVLLLMRDKMRA